jgi:hypothetical protein
MPFGVRPPQPANVTVSSPSFHKSIPVSRDESRWSTEILGTIAPRAALVQHLVGERDPPAEHELAVQHGRDARLAGHRGHGATSSSA